MKPDMEKIIEVLISLLEEQEKVEITYTIEKTAQAVERWISMKKAYRSRKAVKIHDLENKLNFYRLTLVITIMALAVVLVGCLQKEVIALQALKKECSKKAGKLRALRKLVNYII